MVNQTQMNGQSASARQPHKGLGRSLSDLKGDIVSLAELQWQLLLHDARTALRGSLVPALVAVLGIVLIGCAIPVALMGAAHLLVQTGLSLAWSLLIVAGGATLLGGLAAFVGAHRARRSLGAFDRSRLELQDNMAWLKQALRQAQTDDDPVSER